jgi:hypothetical protein
MNKLHITQDDHNFWMLSLEQEDGTMTVLAHQFPTPEHLIENANEMVAKGLPAIVLVDQPREQRASVASDAAGEYSKPAPRKVRS